MKAQTAQNILNILLRDTTMVKGSEINALLDAVRELQAVINGESAPDSEGGSPETPPDGGPA